MVQGDGLQQVMTPRLLRKRISAKGVISHGSEKTSGRRPTAETSTLRPSARQRLLDKAGVGGGEGASVEVNCDGRVRERRTNLC